MSEQEKVVETKTETATTQQGTESTSHDSPVDYEAVLHQKDAEIAKVREEKENYRKGLLKAKGKLPEDNDADTSNPENLEEIIDRKVQERFLSTREAQLQAEKDATISALAKRTKELEVALKSRGQVFSPSGQGANQEKPEGKKDTYFSNEQISALKARGYDDKKIEQLKKNMTKVNEMPKL